MRVRVKDFRIVGMHGIPSHGRSLLRGYFGGVARNTRIRSGILAARQTTLRGPEARLGQVIGGGKLSEDRRRSLQPQDQHDADTEYADPPAGRRLCRDKD